MDDSDGDAMRDISQEMPEQVSSNCPLGEFPKFHPKGLSAFKKVKAQGFQ
jgi:hypothetical protein